MKNQYFTIQMLKNNSMKKFTLVLAAALLYSAGLIAQPSLHIGIKGGANMTKIDGEQYSDGFRFNYYLGPFLQLQLTKGFGIQPEVLFTQSSSRTGSQFSDVYDEFGSEFNDHEIKLNYLTIPVLANIHLSNALILQLGPQYSILMDNHKSLVQNGKDAFKSGDVSGVGGLWINLPLGLSISGRYVIGLSNIRDVSDNTKWNSEAIQLGVGFRF